MGAEGVGSVLSGWLSAVAAAADGNRSSSEARNGPSAAGPCPGAAPCMYFVMKAQA